MNPRFFALVGVVVLLVGFSVSCFAALPAPQLLSPYDGQYVTFSEINGGKLILKWSEVPGAIYFRVEVDGPDQYDPEDDNTGNGFFEKTLQTAEYALTNITLSGEFTWRVQALDGSFNPGSWSASRVISVASSIPTDTPTVRQPQYDLNNDYRLNSKDLVIFSLNEWHKQGASLPGDLNWDGVVDDKDLLMFLTQMRTNPAVPTPTPTPYLPAPQLSSPSKNVTLYMPLPDGLDFSWNSVPGAQAYRVQIDFDIDNMPPFTDIFEMPELAFHWNRLVYPGTGSWKVCAIQANGQRGPWSQEWPLVIEDPVLTPTPTSTPTPADIPAVDMNSDGRVDEKDLFSYVKSWYATTASAKYSADLDLANDGKIDSKDFDLFYRYWDDRNEIAQRVVLNWPGRSQSVSSATYQSRGLEWQARSGVTTYEVYVMYPTGTLSTRKISATSYKAQLFQYGKYHWKVRTFAPEVGPWSEYRAFTLIQ